MEWLVSPSATSPATSSSRPVSRGPALAGLAEEAEHRLQNLGPVTVVEQVARTRQRDQRRPGDKRGDLSPQPEACGPSASRCRTAVRARIVGSSALMSVS